MTSESYDGVGCNSTDEEERYFLPLLGKSPHVEYVIKGLPSA